MNKIKLFLNTSNILSLFFILCTLLSACGSQVPFQTIQTSNTNLSFGLNTNTEANAALAQSSLSILRTCNDKAYPIATVTVGGSLPLMQGANCRLTLTSFTLASSQEVFTSTSPANLSADTTPGIYVGSLGNTATITPTLTQGSLSPVGSAVSVFFAYQSSNTVAVTKESGYRYFGVVTGQTGTFQLTFSTLTGSVSNLTLSTSGLPTGFSVSKSTCSALSPTNTCIITLTFSPSSTHASIQTLTLPYTYLTDDGNSHSSQLSLNYQGLNRQKWVFSTGSNINTLPVLNAAGDTLYVTSNDNKLYSLDTTSGNLNWSYTSLLGSPTSPTLSKDEGTVFLGTSSGKALAVSVATHNLLWSNTTSICSASMFIKPTVTLDGLTLLMPCYNPQRVVGLATTTGTALWNTTSLGTTGVSLAVPTLDGLSFIIGGVYTNTVYKYLLSNQTSIQTANTGLEMQSTPTLNADGSLIYFPSGQVAGSNKLYVFRTSDMSTVWSSATLGGYCDASPTLSPDGSVVYITASDRYVYAFSTKQTSSSNIPWLWTSGTTTGTWNSKVAVSPDGKVIYAPGNLGLYAFNAADGSAKWAPQFNTPNALTQTAPVISPDGNTIYFNSNNNSVYALNADVVKY